VADAKTHPEPAATAAGAGKPLLRQLRRLTSRAAAARTGDRAQLVALIDDLETVRLALLRECARLDDELKLAARRVMALDAYSRNRRPAGVPHRHGH
jgi:hypothetical protein